ncbi:MAG TPA: PilZ domain-containing protein [Myxococcota bacterium]|nr:PilZ domain-containing protein [Myxococcota bacterium]HRY91978.1 PilZ domain-containing protein [Myxococcota bacterium]HSA21366.1 PilZ domain-containing protein [Myxococcota bacterium]
MSERRNGDDRREGSRSAERRSGDRRESHRVAISVEVRVGNGPYESHMGNVGIGGMYFEKPLDLPTGAMVQLRFTLPEMDKAVEAKAEVVEITAVGKPSAVGTRVRFVDLDLRNELLIARFLDQHKQPG